MEAHRIRNPILPGFYPDPSICRVGEDYYICCSSFEAYPGLPVFHSRDLAHWEQIGCALTKENGFHVDANTWAGGVMAPTIRYHRGTYYIMNCNFADQGNFILTAKDPAGPWSQPHWLKDVPGIDASLFFDDDGRCYVMGTGDVVPRPDGTRDHGIWAAEFDIRSFRLLSEPVAIWDSALRNAASPEAPHLYHVGEYYYLLIAEGGTEHYHCVSVARSREPLAWYEGNPANPVLTHRHLGYGAAIANVGHADLVQTQHGRWYAVALGSRTIGGNYKNFGRETFLTPVCWERGWPVFAPDTGLVEAEYPADPDLPWTEYPPEGELEHFDSPNLAPTWTFWGTPYDDFFHIADSRCSLRCLPHPIAAEVKPFGYPRTEGNNVALLGRRQRHAEFEIRTLLEFDPQQNEEAGLVVMQQCAHQYLLRRCLSQGHQVIQLVLNRSELKGYPWLPGFSCVIHSKVLEELPYEGSRVVLGMKAEGQDYVFFYGAQEDRLTALHTHGDGRLINPEEVGPMVGTLLGMYASANGTNSANCARFDFFVYRPNPNT